MKELLKEIKDFYKELIKYIKSKSAAIILIITLSAIIGLIANIWYNSSIYGQNQDIYVNENLFENVKIKEYNKRKGKITFEKDGTIYHFNFETIEFTRSKKEK